VFVCRMDGGLVKGSGRAGAGIDFLSVAESANELFERIGGHPQAFGFSMKPENVEPFLERISLFMEGLDAEEPTLYIDMEIRKNDITRDFLTLIALAEPFGKGNEEPLLLLRGICIDSFSRFGKGNSHGRFTVDKDKNITAIGWSMADEIERFCNKAIPADIVFSITEERFCGIRLIIKDIDKN